ncbi:50S ribosomal protein L18 [Candidatus Micrarchaeota archaeon]|nr:50S ribosomal protein L18 [Candidatus Micrarchaeota archaeon]
MTKATGPLFQVHFRRRREGRTDYQKRLALLKSGKPRLVVRKTNRYVIVQLVTFSPQGDRVIASATSKDLNAFNFTGKCNTPSAYLTGLLVGTRAKAKGVKDFVLDIGLHAPTQGSLVFAGLKGAVDAGLTAPHSNERFPDEARMNGEHIQLKEAVLSAKQKILGGAT